MKIKQALNELLDRIGDGLVIASNGQISRELFELRKKRGEPTDDFYCQGAMGCVLGIGLGVALNTKKQVYVLTGDGALLMKLGSLATIAKHNLDNLRIVVLNNNSHASTGGQPTAFQKARDWVSRYCEIIDIEGGVRPDLGRPNLSCEQIKTNFMKKCVKYISQ